MPKGVTRARTRARTYFERLGDEEFLANGVGGGDVRNLGYQPALEGLRAILLTLVVVGHAQQYLVGKTVFAPLQGLGLMSIFFLLSGFLISSILVKSHQRTGSVQYGKFFRRRIQRLYTPLLLFVAVYFVVNALLGEPLFLRPGGRTLGIVESSVLMITSTINFAPTFGYAQRFDTVQMWSLGVDLQLYLLLPLIILLLFRWTTNLRRLVGIIAGMFVGLQLLRIFEYKVFYYDLPDHDTRTAVIAQAGVYERPEHSAGAFLVGVALYLVWSKGLMPVRLFRKMWLPTVLVLGVLVAKFSPMFSDFSYWIGFTIVSLLGAVVVGETLREGSPIWRVFSSRIALLLGRVSYTVYIWHMFVFILFNRFVTAPLLAPVRILGALAALGVVSAVAWWIAERPLVRLPPVRLIQDGRPRP